MAEEVLVSLTVLSSGSQFSGCSFSGLDYSFLCAVEDDDDDPLNNNDDEDDDILKTSIEEAVDQTNLNEMYKCIFCNFSCKGPSAISRHMYNHADKSADLHICPMCNAVLKTVRNFTRHCMSHLTQARNMYRCKICSQGFTRHDNLKKHIRQRHFGEQPLFTSAPTQVPLKTPIGNSQALTRRKPRKGNATKWPSF